MRIHRFKFSTRSLLIAFAFLAVFLAATIQFGPHVIWKTVRSDVSSGVVRIPSKPLVTPPIDIDLVTCRVGPMSFKLPQSMAKNISVQPGWSGLFLEFRDDDDARSLLVSLPEPEHGLLQAQIADYPDKARLTFPRLFKEIIDADSSDFSFMMSHRELRWHKWLLRSRKAMREDPVEYLWGPELEGVLRCHPSVHTFQWATVDRQWVGTLHFRSTSDTNWVRHVCESLSINGDPNSLRNCSQATLASMVTVDGVKPEINFADR